MLSAPFTLQPPAISGYTMGGNPTLFSNAAGRAMSLQYLGGWHPLDGSRSDFSCWSSGNATQRIQNPHAFAVNARLRFSLVAAGPRAIRLKLNGEDIWQTTMGNNQVVTVSLGSLRLLPGENRLEWQTDAAAIHLGTDPRDLAFMVQNLRLEVLREWTDSAAH